MWWLWLGRQWGNPILWEFALPPQIESHLHLKFKRSTMPNMCQFLQSMKCSKNLLWNGLNWGNIDLNVTVWEHLSNSYSNFCLRLKDQDRKSSHDMHYVVRPLFRSTLKGTNPPTMQSCEWPKILFYPLQLWEHLWVWGNKNGEFSINCCINTLLAIIASGRS